MRSRSSMSPAIIGYCFSLTARWCQHSFGAAAACQCCQSLSLDSLCSGDSIGLLSTVRPFYANIPIPSIPASSSIFHSSPSGRRSTSIHKLEYVDSCGGIFLLCSNVPLYQSTLQRTQLWLKMIIFAPARLRLLPGPQTGSPSCLTSVLGNS